MINTHTARALSQYKTWADTVLFDSIAQLPAEEAVKPRRTLFKSMVGTLNHNLVVDLIWKAHLLQVPHDFTRRDVLLHAELADLRTAQEQENAWFEAWANEQTDSSLLEVLPFRFVSGQEASMSRGAMFMHVVNHASYHRGWVCEMFFDVPARPPATDLPVFLGARPDVDRVA
ncbi:MAG TPA: DinB family protein [Paraburkholderia sp.]|nr:DinB family protein [Paraburkholderia sp.]